MIYTLHPILISANELVFSCCTCTISDGDGNVLEDPKYATAYVCQVCDHTVCEGCYRDGLCPGCWFESAAEHWRKRE